MIRLTILFLLTAFLLLDLRCYGQTNNSFSTDTLVFRKKKNKEIKFLLPLNKYGISIKPINGKSIYSIVTGYTDTTLIVKKYSFEKGDEKDKKNKELTKIYSDSSLTDSQIENLSNMVLFSINDTIQLSQIDKIEISSYNIKEMKKINKITEWSAGLWFAVGAPALAIVKSGVYAINWFILGAGIVTVSLIIDDKVIKLNKWEIVY